MGDTPQLRDQSLRGGNAGAPPISQDLLAYKIDSLVDSVGLLVETIRQLEHSHGGLSHELGLLRRDFEQLADGLKFANTDIQAIAKTLKDVGIGEHSKADLEYLHAIRLRHDERGPVIRGAKVAAASALTIAACAWLWTAAQNQVRAEIARPQPQQQVK